MTQVVLFQRFGGWMLGVVLLSLLFVVSWNVAVAVAVVWGVYWVWDRDFEIELSAAMSFVVLGVGLWVVQGDGREILAANAGSVGERAQVVEGVYLADVVHVVDGDTILVRRVDSGVVEEVRYIGVDTPEIGGNRAGMQCLGAEATAKNVELVSGRRVELFGEVGDEDAIGRKLRHVRVDGRLAGVVLAEEGYARVMSVSPNVSREDEFLLAQRSAALAGLGVWGEGCFGAGYTGVVPR